MLISWNIRDHLCLDINNNHAQLTETQKSKSLAGIPSTWSKTIHKSPSIIRWDKARITAQPRGLGLLSPNWHPQLEAPFTTQTKTQGRKSKRIFVTDRATFRASTHCHANCTNTNRQYLASLSNHSYISRRGWAKQ